MEILMACVLLALFCTSCTLIGNINVASLPDPFAQPPRGMAIQPMTKLILEAIININGKQEVALAYNQEHITLGIGDTFKGFLVAKINSTSVQLIKGRKKYVLHVN